MSIVVCDTSPIRALVFVGQLELLPRLFGRVFVPPGVAFELREPAGEFDSVHVDEFEFIEIVTPADVVEVTKLREVLDLGESEALVLAKELNADQVLIDELDGRAMARQMGLGLIGTLGVLVSAKKAGLIDAISPIIRRLINDLNFFVSQPLLQSVLQTVGEA